MSSTGTFGKFNSVSKFTFLPCHCRKPPVLLNIPLVRKVGIPVIKRFTGGGTVVVDKDTLFATLLMRQDDMPGVRPYPRDIMTFMEAFYQHVFTKPGTEAFRLKENGKSGWSVMPVWAFSVS